jgi:hypothetical protein
MYGYDREYVLRTTPIYGGLRAARYGDPEDEGYVPLSPTHPLARRLRALESSLAPWSNGPLRRSRAGSNREAHRPHDADDLGGNLSGSPALRSDRWPRYDQAFGRGARPSRGRGGYDAVFRPLHPNDSLARALREEADDLVTDYLREERYGEDYARDIGLRTRGPGDRYRDIARRLSRGGYDRGW